MALHHRRAPLDVGRPAEPGPHRRDLSPRHGGRPLLRESTALCHQVTTLDRAKLVKPIGTLPRPLLLAVNAALRAALDLD
jgi:mRNA-degrading endonuclease toxin of MazEF toxin-antitoxin module